jgi:hypothetical protein
LCSRTTTFDGGGALLSISSISSGGGVACGRTCTILALLFDPLLDETIGPVGLLSINDDDESIGPVGLLSINDDDDDDDDDEDDDDDP